MKKPSDFVDTDTVVSVARLCHELNRTLCIVMGDMSQVPWDDAPEWQRDSAVQGVIFHIDNPHASAAASHDNWMENKYAEGWKYGDIKDPEKKTHPCLVPFEQLPPWQQIKDYLFQMVVNVSIPVYTDIGVRDYDVIIHYMNHRGETQLRKVRPDAIWFGATKWHQRPQWIMDAYDYGKEARRSFAMNDILRMETSLEQFKPATDEAQK